MRQRSKTNGLHCRSDINSTARLLRGLCLSRIIIAAGASKNRNPLSSHCALFSLSSRGMSIKCEYLLGELNLTCSIHTIGWPSHNQVIHLSRGAPDRSIATLSSLIFLSASPATAANSQGWVFSSGRRPCGDFQDFSEHFLWYGIRLKVSYTFSCANGLDNFHKPPPSDKCRVDHSFIHFYLK